MSYFSSYDMAHKFFYNDNNDYYRRAGCRTSIEYNRYYSYGTCIGRLETSKNGRRVCLTSINNFSNTTAKHLRELRNAAPVDCLNVFFSYGDNNPTLDELATRAIKNMDYYSGQKLTQKANREGFLTAFNSFKQLADNFKLSVKMPKKYIELANVINDSAAVKAYKLKEAARAKRAEYKRRAALKKLLAGRSLSELARLAYNTNDLTADERAGIRATINPRGDLSFVWMFEDGSFATSQHVHMDAKEGLTALKLWVAGKLKHGLKVGYYTVLEVTDKFVKIGCHKIPVENIRELATAAGLI